MSEPWHIFQGEGKPHNGIVDLPPPPSWRQFHGIVASETLEREKQIREILRKGNLEELTSDARLTRRFAGVERGKTYQTSEEEKHIVNAAIYLRRPLLITGKPGSGKSSLAFAIAHELGLGRVLEWRITSRSNLKDALYTYDAIGRFQDFEINKGTNSSPPDIGQYIRLGALGTALLPANRPRVLLIDEIDKSDIDLPNDLLHIFEEGAFEIPELKRMAKSQFTTKSQSKVAVLTDDGDETVAIVEGMVECCAFPIIILTSNGERELPPPFLRRCLRLDLPKTSEEKLTRIVEEYFKDKDETDSENVKKRADARTEILADFFNRMQSGDLATDQLLNAIYLRLNGVALHAKVAERSDRKVELIDAVLRFLNQTTEQ